MTKTKSSPNILYSGSRGFTLMETMVATMVLGIALVAIMELFSGGLRSARLAEDHTRATLMAGEKLEEILLTTPLEETTLEGSFDDHFSWTCSIKPEEEGISGITPQPLLQAYHIQLKVTWQTGIKNRDFTLNTIRIAQYVNEREAL